MSWTYKDLGINNGHHIWKAMNRCEQCGTEFQSVHPASSKYCKSCATLVRTEQNRERVRRFREKQKQNEPTK